MAHTAATWQQRGTHSCHLLAIEAEDVVNGAAVFAVVRKTLDPAESTEEYRGSAAAPATSPHCPNAACHGEKGGVCVRGALPGSISKERESHDGLQVSGIPRGVAFHLAWTGGTDSWHRQVVWTAGMDRWRS